MQKALIMKPPDAWARATPIFDDDNLVSFAGLAPVMALAERAGLSELIGERVRFRSTSVASAGVNPAGKLRRVTQLRTWAGRMSIILMEPNSGIRRLLIVVVYRCRVVSSIWWLGSHTRST